ncbi:MAG TPA: hypothetical protein VHB25_14370 [Gemmatimonadaceae bacterium]|nr:hypothetical protein [Gemmatimonadaceae bacterium]
MRKIASALAATIVAAGALVSPAGAQSLANRVAAVRDGVVHFHFAVRSDVCGNSETGFFTMRGRGADTGWQGRPCIHGPMQVELTRSAGRTSTVRICIGCEARDGSVEAGEIAPAEAARYLVSAAHSLSRHGASSALAAATVADGVDISPELTALVQDGSASIETRKDALFWLGQSGAPTANLARLYPQLAPIELREQFTFVLSQRRADSAAIEKLIDVAQHDPELDVRKKAMFWLGQTHDPRAIQFFRSILVR